MDGRWRTAAGAVTKLVCLMALATSLGCTGGGGATNLDTSKDEGAINMLLVELADTPKNQALADRVFDKASMPKPAEREKFTKYNFRVIEHVIDGASAKMKVEVTDFNGAVVGTQDWTATKADGAWKLQSTPVP